jgi:hypothetical protein
LTKNSHVEGSAIAGLAVLSNENHITRPYKKRSAGKRLMFMHPMFIVAIPLVLVIVGMVLNSIGLYFDQPPSSREQDPTRERGGTGRLPPLL